MPSRQQHSLENSSPSIGPSLHAPPASSLSFPELRFLHRPPQEAVLLWPALPCPSLTPSSHPQIVSSASTDLQDYTYYFVPAPWLSVKLLRLLQCYPPPGTAESPTLPPDLGSGASDPVVGRGG